MLKWAAQAVITSFSSDYSLMVNSWSGYWIRRHEHSKHSLKCRRSRGSTLTDTLPSTVVCRQILWGAAITPCSSSHTSRPSLEQILRCDSQGGWRVGGKLPEGWGWVAACDGGISSSWPESWTHSPGNSFLQGVSARFSLPSSGRRRQEGEFVEAWNDSLTY